MVNAGDVVLIASGENELKEVKRFAKYVERKGNLVLKNRKVVFEKRRKGRQEVEDRRRNSRGSTRIKAHSAKEQRD